MKKQKAEIKVQKLNFDKIISAISLIYFIGVLSFSVGYRKVGNYDIETDFFWDYAIEARNILKGIVNVGEFRGPGYPAIVAMISLFTGDSFTSGLIISAISSSLVILITFKTLKKIFDDKIAFAVSLTLILNPTFLRYSYVCGTDMFFNFLVSSAVFFAIIGVSKNKNTLLFLSGLAGGYAYLTRYNGISLLVGLPLMILILNYKNLKNGILRSIFALSGYLAFLLPWSIYSYIKRGEFFYNRNYLNIAYEMYAKGKIPWDNFWFEASKEYKSFVDVFLRDPALFIEKAFLNLIDHFWRDLTQLCGWQFTILFILGLILMINRKIDNIKIAYFVQSLTFFLVLVFVFYSERFSMYLLPTYLSICYYIISWEKIERTKFGWLIILTVLNLISLPKISQMIKRDIDNQPFDILYVREQFKAKFGDSERGKIIVARKPNIAYYLNMEFKPFPLVNNYDELYAELVKLNASYLYYSWIEYYFRRNFESLFNYTSPPPFLETVAVSENPPAVLYKVKR
ncbi:ArnT family glycosyltransferase [Candidatus Kryptobacter tengchongensis]|uniref:ArnT family glycosyltransferase n=1 Tax=Kryptobacter tengchongensis TaxID=1643429 RepID=UPI0007074DE1|nr:glycosyltransferase family 39 protein [Candidatus Kryptobacter tengchongensis]CUS84504.1 Dolichyl-phosphate-mannose-protein mannosyltransferase [Candidatus Kryptobacter tengchongensis]